MRARISHNELLNETATGERQQTYNTSAMQQTPFNVHCCVENYSHCAQLEITSWWLLTWWNKVNYLLTSLLKQC